MYYSYRESLIVRRNTRFATVPGLNDMFPQVALLKVSKHSSSSFTLVIRNNDPAPCEKSILIFKR